MLDFEIIDRDAAGRISKLRINNKKITLPNIAVVVNPNKMLLTPKELQKDFSVNTIITNAYIIKKTAAAQAKKKGLHKFLGFDGLVLSDSGAYQAMRGKQIEFSNKQIILFQEQIKPDIAVFLDVPTGDLNRKDAPRTVNKTIKNAQECKRLTKNSQIAWSGAIQGGEHLELLAYCAKRLAKLNFDLYAVGSIVTRLERYEFSKVCEQIITAKLNLPSCKPLHAFGVGLPMFMSLAVAVGSDIFDSAAYALYAYDDRYMTLQGTMHLQALQEFPCSCPECTKTSPEEIKKLQKQDRERFLARHNLFVTLAELRTIKEAIRGQWLWELVQQRCRAHPRLLEAMTHIIKKYKSYFLEKDLFSKKSAFQWSGVESDYRPEALRAKSLLKNVKSKKYFTKEPFGKIPVELQSVYPFTQSVIPFYKEKEFRNVPKNAVKALLDYQFGKNASQLLFKKDIEIEISRKTGRIRRIYSGDDTKNLLGTIRAEDGLFLPTIAGAEMLKKHMKKLFIKDKEVVALIKQGKGVFAKFCETKDDIVPGEEVAVCDAIGSIIAIGRALLNKKEMKEFKRGEAVKVRAHV